MHAVHIKPQLGSEAPIDKKESGQTPPFGSLPTPPSESRCGFISGEGRLTVGKIEIPVEKLSHDLHRFTKLCGAIKKFFKSAESLKSFLECVKPTPPQSSASLPTSLEALREVLVQGDIEGRAYTWRRVLDAGTGKRALSESELQDLRTVLTTATFITTAVCAIDQGVESRAVSALSRVLEIAKAYLTVPPSLLDRYQKEAPFDAHEPQYLRLDLDKWAQRLRLGDEGSPVIRLICKAEVVAARVLESGRLERESCIKDSRLVVQSFVRQPGGDRIAFAAESTIPHLYSVLMLAQSASRLIEDMNREGVDLVRMCRLANRRVAVEMQVHIRSIPEAALSRLSDLSEWAPRFDVRASSVLSAEESADLAVLLLDAEALHRVMDALKGVLAQPWSERWWHSRWSDAISDRDVKAALRLIQLKGAMLECDFAMTADLARSGSLALGYSPEDRMGSAWRVPENQVHSLAWVFSRGAPDLKSLVVKP
jgi:hypothetical protein